MPIDLKNNPLTFFIRTKRKQRTKVDSTYSLWEMLLSGALQGSILGPLLFNIYICDIFFETPKNIEFTVYPDDNTRYTCSSNIEEVLENFHGGIRATLSMVFCTSLGSKCRKLITKLLKVKIKTRQHRTQNLHKKYTT